MKFLVLLFAFFLPINKVLAEAIHLNNGDILNAVIKHQTENSLVIDHSSLGEISIPKGKIANLQSFNLHTVKKLDTPAIAKKEEAEPLDEGLLGTGLLVGWDRSIDVGLNGASGPSNNSSFRIGVNAHYEDREDRWDFKTVYIFKQEDDITTDNVVNVDLLKDWFLPDSQFFYFAQTGFDWDAFKDWDYRFRWSGGPGYQFIKTENFEFAVRAGLSGIYEIMQPKNSSRAEGLVGLDFSWKINQKQSLKVINTFFPAITDSGNYRNVTHFEWVHNLDFYDGLAIKIGFNNEYDTTQTEKNDLKYYANIAWGL